MEKGNKRTFSLEVSLYNNNERKKNFFFANQINISSLYFSLKNFFDNKSNITAINCIFGIKVVTL